MTLLKRPQHLTISPAQLTANQNDWAPTNILRARLIRVSTNASRDLTGIVAQAPGRTITLVNVGSNDLVLKDASGSSSAANRFALNGDITLGADHGAVLFYDGTTARWRVSGQYVAAGGGGSTASTTEVLTGTDTAKSVTPDALAALWEQGSNVASAGTISLGEGGYFFITGNTTITDIDFATDKAGRPAILKFGGSLSLTHSATLICPEARDLVVHDGDVITVVSEGSDVVRVVNVERAQPILFKCLAADDTGGQNVNTAQPWFPTNGAVTVKANTTYRIRGLLWTTRAAGVTGHTTSLLFGGTATLTSLLYSALVGSGQTPGNENRNGAMISAATAVVVKATSNSATENVCIEVYGTIRTNGAGTLIPQFQYSAAPGGAPTIKSGTMFELVPLGAGAVTESGAWA